MEILYYSFDRKSMKSNLFGILLESCSNLTNSYDFLRSNLQPYWHNSRNPTKIRDKFVLSIYISLFSHSNHTETYLFKKPVNEEHSNIIDVHDIKGC